MPKPYWPIKLFMGGVEIDVKSIEIQAMADQDPAAFQKHMNAMAEKVAKDVTAKIYGPIGKFDELFPNTPDLANSLTSASDPYGPSPLEGAWKAMAKMREWQEVQPCEHCSDRAFWRLGTMVTFVGRMCHSCIDECFQRGITIRRITRRRVYVCRPVTT